MKEKFLAAIIAFVLLQLAVRAESRFKVYVLDTGINFNAKYYKQGNGNLIYTPKNFKKFRCKDSPINKDTHGHGTHMAIRIVEHLDFNKVCLYDLKYYFDNQNPGDAQGKTFALLSFLYHKKPGVVNYSGGGFGYNETEARLIIRLIQKGFKFSLAAGNESLDLSAECDYYPACYYLKNTKVSTNFHKSTNKKGPVTHKQKSSQLGASSEATAMTTSQWVRKLTRGK